MGKVKKIMVVGLGEVGSTVLLEANDIIQERNLPYQLVAAEIDKQKIDKFSKMGFKVFNSFEQWDKCDGYLICVFTISQILDTLAKIEQLHQYKEDYWVSIESTVDPNYAGLIYALDLKNLVIVPHRLVFNNPKYGAFNIERLFGCPSGLDRRVNVPEEAYNFYRDFMSKPLKIVEYQIAILSKVIENAYRFCDIVFAQELKRSCDDKGIDFDTLRSSVNTKWNIDLKEARDGVGGHCLPKETKFAMNYFKSNPLFRTFYALNELYKNEKAKE